MSDTMSDKRTGTVKWYSIDKGYGFLIAEDGSGDVFVHSSAVKQAGLRSLEKRQTVSFDIADNKGRPVAVNIAVLP